jgi:hypothetical protein
MFLGIKNRLIQKQQTVLFIENICLCLCAESGNAGENTCVTYEQNLRLSCFHVAVLKVVTQLRTPV